MRYISWAAFYEGGADALYLDVLLPRLLRDIVARDGTGIVDVPDVPAVKLGKLGREVEKVAEEACEFRDAYDLIFIHADTGGRALEEGLTSRSSAYCAAFAERCDWPLDRCVTVTPRHETEAWLLADASAVTDALGYNGKAGELGLPADAKAAERLADPKQTLRNCIDQVSGRRRAQRIETIFPAIAQRQSLDQLCRSASFQSFELRLRACLVALRCLPKTE